jgi:hypothetical protein
MTASAAFSAAMGLVLTFMPQELLAHLGVVEQGFTVVLVQMLGVLCLGFATLNWMTRSSVIGGIYGRPVSMANCMHFAIGAVTLWKGVVAQDVPAAIMAVTAIYTLFGAWFALVLFTHPADALRQRQRS